jgi:hypothetical protein
MVINQFIFLFLHAVKIIVNFSTRQYEASQTKQLRVNNKVNSVQGSSCLPVTNYFLNLLTTTQNG